MKKSFVDAKMQSSADFKRYRSLFRKFDHILILVKIVNKLHIKGSKEFLYAVLDTIVVDVAEQQIERPVANQKQYYSGKKSIQLKSS